MKFTDAKKREWELRVTYTEVLKVRTKRDGFDISKLSQDDVMLKLFSDVCLMCEVAFDLCEEQIDKRQVDHTDFLESIVGDPLDDFANNLIVAVAFFLPGRERAKLLAKLKKALEISEVLTQLTIQAIEAISTASSPASSMPALPESTPTG